ncbi:MAG TPA: c-type cytochrome [Nitrospiria bacterium]
MKSSALYLLFMWVALSSAPLWGAERDPLQPRVSHDQLEKAQAVKNPFPPTAENIARGSVLYHGKGTCFTCHGKEGKGDGLAAPGLDPSPRNFTNSAFHEAKTDGELYWVIKNGSPGTAMMPMIGSVINEEEGWLVLLYERSLGQPKE